MMSRIVVAAAALIAGCGTLPRDPEHTLERVQQQRHMRVGLVENPPWTIRTTGEPVGAEVQLARHFAESLGATPDWYWGGEQDHLEALHKFELDLVIGGLDATTPWQKKVGFTRPYFEERIAVGVPPGTEQPDSLNGVNIVTKGGEDVAAYLIHSMQRRSASPRSPPGADPPPRPSGVSNNSVSPSRNSSWSRRST